MMLIINSGSISIGATYLLAIILANVGFILGFPVSSSISMTFPPPPNIRLGLDYAFSDFGGSSVLISSCLDSTFGYDGLNSGADSNVCIAAWCFISAG